MKSNYYSLKKLSKNDFWGSIESMLDCFAIYSAIRDESGKIVDFLFEYVNDAACECHQMTKEEQLGKKLLELLPAHKQSGLFDEYCKVIETGKPFVTQALVIEDYVGSKGINKAVDIKAVKMNDGYAVSWREVTDRKRVEEALQESEERFRSAFENASNALDRLINHLPENARAAALDYHLLNPL